MKKIIDLVEKYPNDAELGEELRKIALAESKIKEGEILINFDEETILSTVLKQLDVWIKDSKEYEESFKKDKLTTSSISPGAMLMAYLIVKQFIVSELKKNKDDNFPLFEDLYGSYVQMNDGHESVCIWDEMFAIKNRGWHTPTLISKEKYYYEKVRSQNV